MEEYFIHSEPLYRRIINIFLYTGIALLFILLLFIGISQTSTFRNFAKDMVVEILNDQLNGKVSIGELKGTIFTSIEIDDLLLTSKTDTVISAKKIEVKFSPMRIFLKTIYVRKILISDLNLNLAGREDGSWNLGEVLPPSETETDTTSGEFPFTIVVSDLEFLDAAFNMVTFPNLGDFSKQDSLNTENIRIKNLNLRLAAEAHLKDNEYFANIEYLFARTNIKDYDFYDLRGIIEITPWFAEITNFHIETKRTEFFLNARMDSLNIFGDVVYEDFYDYPVRLEADIKRFDFRDLSGLLPSLDFLTGVPEIHLEADGDYGNLNIREITARVNKTKLSLKGRITNLNRPSDMYIDAQISNGKLLYSDINYLLPRLEIPDYGNLLLSDIDAYYRGRIDKFDAGLNTVLNNGELISEAKFDFREDITKYDVSLKTKSLNLFPITGTRTDLNLITRIVGEGFTPAEFNSDIEVSLQQSKYDEFFIDSLSLKSAAKQKKIDIDLNSVIQHAMINVNGKIDFSEEHNPLFDLTGRFQKLNLKNFGLGNPSDINLNFSMLGNGLNPDSMGLNASLDIEESVVNDLRIGDSKLNLVMEVDSVERRINIESDVIDAGFSGRFKLTDAIALFAEQGTTIGDIIQKKIEKINPLDDLTASTETELFVSDTSSVIFNPMDINFNFRFKDFDLLAILLEDEMMDISGYGSGKIINDSSFFAINTDLFIEYFIQRKADKLLYLSDMGVNLNFSRNNQVKSFDNLFGSLFLTAERFYSGSDINKIKADILFNKSTMLFNLSAEYDTLFSVSTKGDFDLRENEQIFTINDLELTYNNRKWKNPEPAVIEIGNNDIDIKELLLSQDEAEIYLSGFVNSAGEQELIIKTRNFKGSRIADNFLNDPLLFDATFNFYIYLGGTLSDPIIESDVEMLDLTISNVKLGNVTGEIDYKAKELKGNLRFLKQTANRDSTILSIKADIPIDLAFADAGQRFNPESEIDIQVFSDDLHLSTLGNIIPYISKQSGSFSSDIQIKGKPNDLQLSGYLNISKGYFRPEINNLDYGLELRTRFEGNTIRFDTLEISNLWGSTHKGKLFSSGEIRLKDFKPEYIDFRTSGDLAILTESRSKSPSATIFGDLIIGTGGEWTFNLENDRPKFNGVVRLLTTNLTFSPEPSTYSTSTDNINYVFLEDSSIVKREKLKFEKIVEESKATEIEEISEGIEKKSYFDYDVSIEVVDNAKITFLLSRVANQKLIAEVDGQLKFESSDGIANTQGSLELLSGSKLEFFKVFDATGKITFESDLTDPRLDILATYSSDYTNPPSARGTTQEVAVKFKMNGLLSQLGANLSNDPENILVYVGSRNIQNNTADRSLDAADAVSFIIMGKFKSDLTPDDKSQVVDQTSILGNTATSFLGTVLSGFVNSAVGDLINNIELSQSGEFTKFNVSGRYNKFRYTIGGTTEIFDNLSKANIRVSYLFSKNFIFRMERKDPIVKTTGLEDKISEIGFQYKFEF